MATSDAMTATNRRGDALPWRLKLGYSSGQVLDGIVSQCLGIFLLFYVTTVCGLPGALAGIALAVGLVVDAFMDPLIGTLSDGWRSRFGRRLPFMMVGMPAVVILFTLIFSLPSGLGTTGLFIWLTVLSIALRIAMSLFILPYSAVGAELSDDYAERSSIAAWRWGVGMLATLIAVMLGFGLFFAGPGGLSHRAAYTPFALTLSALIVVFTLISLRTTNATLDRLHPPVAVTRGLGLRIIGELGEVLRNRSFRILFAGAVLFFSALGTHLALGLHANTYFWRLTPPQIQNVTLAVFLGLLFGAPLAGPFLKRMEKRTILIIGMAGLAAADTVPPALRLMGLFPFEGATLATVLSILVFCGGALMAAAAIAFASMMADAADEHEHLFGARREGLYFAGWAFASKTAGGVGALIAGLVLQAIDFPTDVAAHGGVVARLPDHMVRLLGLFFGPGSGILYLGAILVTLLYSLDSRRHAAIMNDLGERRIALAGAAAMVP